MTPTPEAPMPARTPEGSRPGEPRFDPPDGGPHEAIQSIPHNPPLSDEQRRAVDAALLRLGHALNEATGLATVLELCLASAIEVSGMDSGGAYLVDEESGALGLKTHRGLSPAFVAVATHYSQDSPSGQTVRAGRAVYLSFREADGSATRVQGRAEGLRAVAVVPILYQGHSVACLNVASHTLEEVAPDRRAALELVAAQMGGAIVRARTQARLRESQEDLQTLFDSIDDFVFVVDLEGRILEVNRIVLDRLGYSRDELCGASALMLHRPERRHEAAETLAALLSGSVGTFQIPLATRGGGEIPADTRVARGRWGGVEVLFGISRDMTEHQRVEAALWESERRRGEMDKLAATGRMAARVAHEINNPLAGLQSAFRLVETAIPADHPHRAMTERIDREIARISRIVRQMYQLHSPLAGRAVDAPLSEVLADVLPLLEPLRRDRGVELDTTGIPPGIAVRVPEGGLQQILFNLVANAIEASPPGGTVSIEVEEPAERCGCARISVRDQGTGILPEFQPRVFEPFFTAAKGPLAKEGLGLGLSVVRSVVEASNGTIEFQSEPGAGTVFHVFLPAGGPSS